MDTESLITQAQAGNEEAMNELIKTYFPLVSVNAKNFFIIGADREDLVQEGLIGLLKAIKSYNIEKSSFNSFAMLCIRRQIFSAIKSANSKKNTILNEAILNSFTYSEAENNFEENFISSNNNPEDIFLSQEKLKNFEDFVASDFSKLEKAVFKYLIRGYSYKEIAEQLSSNLKSIDNAMQRIKKKSEAWIKKYNLN